MDIIIQSLGFSAGNSLENFIQEKVGALKADSIIRANVTLYKGPASNPESDYCEIRLEVPGNDHFVKKHADYFENAVTECVEVLAQMIRESKNKNTYKRKTDEILIQDVLQKGEVDNDVELEDGIF